MSVAISDFSPKIAGADLAGQSVQVDRGGNGFVRLLRETAPAVR